MQKATPDGFLGQSWRCSKSIVSMCHSADARKPLSGMPESLFLALGIRLGNTTLQVASHIAI